MELSKIQIKTIVREEILLLHHEQTGEIWVPAAVSNRHVHLDQPAVDALFGGELHVRNRLGQPGQYACEETVAIRGPKGEIGNVRVLGPVRGSVQAELSVTDCYKLGIEPMVCLSGHIQGTPGFTLEGPRGSLQARQGAIVAARHVHVSTKQARAMGLQDGEMLELTVQGARPMTIRGVVVRVADDFELQAHLDTDEANAALIKNDMLLLAQRGGDR